MSFHDNCAQNVPVKAQERLKLSIFWIFLKFWGQKTILIIIFVTNMCRFYVWALDEAFWGDQEQYTYSKYQKIAKNAKISKKMHFWKLKWDSRSKIPRIFIPSMDVLFHGKPKNGIKILKFLEEGGLGPKKWPPLGSNFFLEFFSWVLTPDLGLPD